MSFTPEASHFRGDERAAVIHRAAFDERLPWLTGHHTPEGGSDLPQGGAQSRAGRSAGQARRSPAGGHVATRLSRKRGKIAAQFDFDACGH